MLSGHATGVLYALRQKNPAGHVSHEVEPLLIYIMKVLSGDVRDPRRVVTSSVQTTQ